MQRRVRDGRPTPKLSCVPGQAGMDPRLLDAEGHAHAAATFAGVARCCCPGWPTTGLMPTKRPRISTLAGQPTALQPPISVLSTSTSLAVRQHRVPQHLTVFDHQAPLS